MKILSVGDRLGEGRYLPHSRFPRAANFLRGEALAAVVGEEAGRGPINIVVRGIDPAAADFLEVGGEEIRIGPSVFPRADAETYDSRWEPGPIRQGLLRRNLAVLEDCLLGQAPGESLAFLLDPARRSCPGPSFRGRLGERFAAAAEDLFRSERHLVEGCRRLKGLGPGLTPAGDDFIAGILAALSVLERAEGADRSALRGEIAAAARSGNLLSSTFIALSAAGRFFERLKNLLAALVGDDPAALRRRAGDLLAYGASSGSDLAAGLVLALKKFPAAEIFRDSGRPGR